MLNEERKKRDALRARKATLANRARLAALEEHPEFASIPEPELINVIESAASKICDFEDAADSAAGDLSPSSDKDMSALWVFAGPGTYDGTWLNGSYEGLSWATSMDRARVDRAADIAREWDGSRRPLIIYSGTDDQNAAVLRAVESGDAGMSPDNVIVHGSGLTNTVDTINTFALPEALHVSDGEIGIVSHAPHLMRIVHILNKYKPLPADMRVRLFPLNVPADHREEYATMEIKGLLYYIFKPGCATKEAHPHVVHGGRQG